MRQLVLQIGSEGGCFSLWATGHAGGRRFYDKPDGAADSRSFTWDEMLARELRPRGWLLLHPLLVHPWVADLVVDELRKASRDGPIGHWWRLAALRPALPAPVGDMAVDFFLCSDTARVLAEQGTPLVNRPKEPATWEALRGFERELLEPLAREFGVVTMTYGFAGPELVRAVRKRARAEHRLPNITPQKDQHAGHERNAKGQPICARGGVAADVKVKGVASMDVTDWISKTQRFDRIYRYPPQSSTDPKDRPFHLSWSAEPHGMVVDMLPKVGGGLRPQVVRRGRG